MSSMVSPVVSCGTAGMLPWTPADIHLSDTGAVYVGEGLPPLPKAVVERISEWKYVDMAEMLPKFWALLKGEDDSKKAVARRPKQVTDVHTWLQCFALYSGVLRRYEPNAIPEFMAYMITISRTS